MSRRIFKGIYVVSLLFAPCALLFADVDTSPRIFFSDAKISFTIPNHWDLQPKFPYGPLFIKSVRDGGTASISCAISAPIGNNRISSDIPQETLVQLARGELESHQPGYRTIAERNRRLAGQNAFEITWENQLSTETVHHQTLYLFIEDRVYAFSLRAPPKSFLWAAPDFQHWLESLRVLSRRESGTLTAPAHGGLWIHQTGGVKIPIPLNWLIGVSDDRTLGATFAEDDLHADLTATLDVTASPSKEFSRRDKKTAVKSIRRKGLRIVSETEAPFHGLPSFQVRYEGMLKDRVIKGMDIWVLSPQARWLFNIEGDVSLYNSLTEQYEDLLNNIEFL